VASRALRAYHLGSRIARALPRPVADGIGRFGGTVAVPFAGERRAQVERNLRRVHGPDFGGLALRRAVAATFESYARYYVDSFRLPGTSPEALDAGITVEGWEKIDTALDNPEGNGVILALPHLGGWEWAGFWVAACRGRQITAVVEALEPRDVYEWFVDLRTALGMQVVPLGPGAAAALLKALRSGHVVVLLCDRDLEGNGVEVEFFGERTTLPGGPAALALRTGAPVIPAFALPLRDGRYRMVYEPPIDPPAADDPDAVREFTQRCTDVLEMYVRRHPHLWLWMHRRWRDVDPPAAGMFPSAEADARAGGAGEADLK
jgi:KDO2-lipid IV(A) lauroyltransferase